MASERSAHGTKLLGSGRVLEALDEFRAALAEYPDSEYLALSAANALATLGRHEEALVAYEKTLQIYARAEKPAWRVKSQALTWLGVINRRLKKNKEAIEWLRRSVQFHASHENRHHLAISLAMDVQFAAAAEELIRAMMMSTQDTDFQLLSTLISATQDWPLLERVMSKCLEELCTLAESTYPKWQILLQYGVALQMNNKTAEAQNRFKEAQALSKMDLPTFRSYVGQFVKVAEQNHNSVYKHPEAPPANIEEHRERIREMLEPLLSGTKNPADLIQRRYIHGHVWPIPQGIATSAIDALKAQRQIFEHDPYAQELDQVVKPWTSLQGPVFDVNDTVFVAQVRTSRLHKSMRADGIAIQTDFDRSKYGAVGPDDRLHVGLFSADIRPHPMLPVIRGFVMFAPKDQVKITLFHHAADRETLELIKPHVDATYECADKTPHLLKSALDYARHNKVHVWLETTGETGMGIPQLAAARPAPVGVLWAGYPGSLADPALSYMVADRYSVPRQVAMVYPEKIIYLPGSWLINDLALSQPDSWNETVASRAELRKKYGIPEDATVFANFGRTWKIDGDVLKAWCEILERTPHSYLVLLNYRVSEIDQPGLVDNLRASFVSSGLPTHRLVILPPFRRGEHVEVLGRLADIALDTTLYGGGMTALEALRAGIPLVHSSQGAKLMQRAGGSVLVAAALADDLVVDSMDEYVTLAIRLAVDPEFYQRIRAKIDDANHGRGDAVAFRPEIGATALVKGLREAYKNWHSQEKPKHIFADGQYRFVLYDEFSKKKVDDASQNIVFSAVPTLDLKKLKGWTTDF